MFNRELVKHLQDEIKILRDMNSKLLDQIVVLSGKATESLAMQQAAMPHQPVSFLNYVTGEIEKMPAETEEEQEQKAAAIREADQMFKTAGVM